MFQCFLLVVPAIGALLILLFRIALAIQFALQFGAPSTGAPTTPMLLFAVVGTVETVFVFIHGLPIAFLIALCALLSYLVFRRVSFVIVLVAMVVAVGFENVVIPLSSHGVLVSDDVLVSDEEQVRVLQLHPLQVLIHLIPAVICWWIVRNERLPTS